MEKVYPIRYDDEQYDGLEKAAKRFRVVGRQKAQREINRLYMSYFGIINDPIAAASMEALIARRQALVRRRKQSEND